MGESDSIPLANTTVWSFVHASAPSDGVADSCGDPVEFPGCVILYQSKDGAQTFQPLANEDGQIRCLIPCLRCPCDSRLDHVDQQQYPQVVRIADAIGKETWLMVYEYRANTMLRRSADGLDWSPAEEIPLTGIWRRWLMDCEAEERIGPHPFAGQAYDCLSGGPPGIAIAPDANGDLELYVFVGQGQNPGHMGCYRGSATAPAALLRKCSHNPLFRGATTYGPTDLVDARTNPFFDFRTISSAEVLAVADRYYMLYEGVRGPDAGAGGDTQFALGMARSLTDRIDGPWERYTGNPILVDQPGNVGVGHSDLLVLGGRTYLFTSLDGNVRSRLVLKWVSE